MAELWHRVATLGERLQRFSFGGAFGPVEEIDALLLYSDSFGLSAAQARSILREVVAATESWEAVARRNGISQSEANRFLPTLKQTMDALRRG